MLIFSCCSAQMRNIGQPKCKFIKKIVRVEIDRIDRGILDALQRDGSLSAADVASQVGLSTTTC
ncbi:MAG TPA: AsnC family protein, partial [Steroidobacteraceae bacterium]|nr:AsnC family protein [Steroidobacteraceae bacterium]